MPQQASNGIATAATEAIIALFRDRAPDSEILIQSICERVVSESIEQCARQAEDFVANEDIDGDMSGIQVGDSIAAVLRGSLAEGYRYGSVV